MRPTQRILTTILLWIFAMALPLRPIAVILHNCYVHAALHPHSSLHSVPKGRTPTSSFVKKVQSLKKIAKRTNRSHYLIPPSQRAFVRSFFRSGPTLPKDRRLPSQELFSPLRI